MYRGTDTDHITHRACKRLFHSGNIFNRVVKLLGTKLNVNVEGVGVILSAELNKIILGEAFGKKNCFYL